MKTYDYLEVLYYWMKSKIAESSSLEQGTIAETVVLTALFVALAIVAGTMIYNAVKAKAASITYNTPSH